MGKVNLIAQNASLRAILNEWARVGGTRLVNPERLTGGPSRSSSSACPNGRRSTSCCATSAATSWDRAPRWSPACRRSIAWSSSPPSRADPRRRGPSFPAPRPHACGRVATPIEREPIVDDDDDDDPEPDTPERAEPAARVRPGAPICRPDCRRSPRTPSPRPSRPVPTPRRAIRSASSRVRRAQARSRRRRRAAGTSSSRRNRSRRTSDGSACGPSRTAAT